MLNNLKCFKMIKQKKCKGQRKAKEFKGCNTLTNVEFLKYGLCKNCYKEFLFSDLGKDVLASAIIQGKKETAKKERKETREKRQELNPLKVMNLADMYFSRYIRVLNSSNGLCTCYTCGTIKDLKEVDNGHYIKRQHKATRYSELNCKPQCKICNGDTKHNGKEAIFRQNLVNEYGEEKVIELEVLGKSTIKADSKFFKDIANTYREKLNALQKQLKVKYW